MNSLFLMLIGILGFSASVTTMFGSYVPEVTKTNGVVVPNSSFGVTMSGGPVLFVKPGSTLPDVRLTWSKYVCLNHGYSFTVDLTPTPGTAAGAVDPDYPAQTASATRHLGKKNKHPEYTVYADTAVSGVQVPYQKAEHYPFRLNMDFALIMHNVSNGGDAIWWQQSGYWLIDAYPVGTFEALSSYTISAGSLTPLVASGTAILPQDGVITLVARDLLRGTAHTFQETVRTEAGSWRHYQKLGAGPWSLTLAPEVTSQWAEGIYTVTAVATSVSAGATVVLGTQSLSVGPALSLLLKAQVQPVNDLSRIWFQASEETSVTLPIR